MLWWARTFPRVAGHGDVKLQGHRQCQQHHTQWHGLGGELHDSSSKKLQRSRFEDHSKKNMVSWFSCTRLWMICAAEGWRWFSCHSGSQFILPILKDMGPNRVALVAMTGWHTISQSTCNMSTRLFRRCVRLDHFGIFESISGELINSKKYRFGYIPLQGVFVRWLRCRPMCNDILSLYESMVLTKLVYFWDISKKSWLWEFQSRLTCFECQWSLMFCGIGIKSCSNPNKLK